MSEITTEQMIEWIDMWFFEEPDLSMLKAIRSRLSEYDALKAEVEEYQRRSGNDGRLIMEIRASREYWMRLAEKAEADLAAARPLLEAVEQFDIDDIFGLTASYVRRNTATIGTCDWLLKAIRAYRAAKEAKEKP